MSCRGPLWAVDLVPIISHIQVTNNKPSSKAEATITLGLIGYANGWIGYTTIPNMIVLCCFPAKSQTFSVFFIHVNPPNPPQKIDVQLSLYSYLPSVNQLITRYVLSVSQCTPNKIDTLW